MALATSSPVKQKKPGCIVTFYSFKGGVGRSMALANVAVLLARKNHRVLCIDWDLEAPGLGRYFSAEPHAYQVVPDYKPSSLSSKIIQNEKTSLSKPKQLGGLLSVLKNHQEGNSDYWREYLCTRTGSDGIKVDFLGSGDDAKGYSDQLAAFSWEKFFAEQQGGEILENLRRQWKKEYDYILVDSRTGLTDASGICTIQMPDIIVLMFAANMQNTSWCKRVADSFLKGRRVLPYDRVYEMPIIPLLSHIDESESELAAAVMNRVAEDFEPFFRNWLPDSIKIYDFIAVSSLVYTPRYSYKETLTVEENPIIGQLHNRYELLARFLDVRLSGIQDILASLSVPGAALLPTMPELRANLFNDNEAIQHYRNKIKSIPTDRALEAVKALEILAQACVDIETYADNAIAVLEDAINILENSDPIYIEEIPRLLGLQGRIFADFGRSEEARALYLEAIRRAKELFENGSIYIQKAENNLTLFEQEETQKHESMQKSQTDTKSPNQQTYRSVIDMPTNHQTGTERSNRDHEVIHVSEEQSNKIMGKLNLAEDNEYIGRNHWKQAISLREKGSNSDAREEIYRAHRILKPIYGAGHVEIYEIEDLIYQWTH